MRVRPPITQALARAALVLGALVLAAPLLAAVAAIAWPGTAPDIAAILPAARESAAFALVVALGKTGLALGAAYALVFFRLPLAPILCGLIVAALLMPVELRLAATAETFGSLRPSVTGLALALVGSPIAAIVLWRTMARLPGEVIDAARLDGAGPVRLFTTMVYPMSRPVTGAIVAIMTIDGWNEYVWPLVAVNDPTRVSLMRLIAAGAASPDSLAGLAVLAAAPPVALALVFRRTILRGLGAIAGAEAGR